MGIDGKLKRFFPLLLCAAIALAAYFQASGIGRLVAASVSGSAPVAPLPQVARGVVSTPTIKSGQAILARNPFDSITGPLDGTSSPVALPEPSDEAPLSEGTSEDDPACGFGRVILISASDDPSWSFAAIDDGKGKSQLRRVGDSVAGHTLQAMGWDRIWLAEGSKRCQLRLGVASASPAPQGNAGRIVRPNKGPRRGARDLAPELAAKIHKVSDTEFNIERSVVDEILENQAQLMRSARIMPEKEGDNVVGIKLYGIREGSLLSHLGMSNGDRLDSINGFEMGDPQKALEAYGRLRSASSLKVQINRKGTPTTIEYNIQ